MSPEIIANTIPEATSFVDRTAKFGFDLNTARYHEAHTMAVIVDLLLREDHLDALEVAVRRYQALLCREEDGNWDMGAQIESRMAKTGRSRLPPSRQRNALSMLRLKNRSLKVASHE